MKVLLVTALVGGGVATHVRMLAAGLVAHGHAVVVACPPPVVPLIDPGDGVRFLEVPVGSRPHPVQDRRAVSGLRAAIRGADVVHAHGLRAGALAVTARQGIRTSAARLVVTSHNAPPEGRTSRVVYAVLEQVVAHGADLVLGVSPDLVDRARRAGARRTGLAVVPAALARRRPKEELIAVRSRVRRHLGLSAQGTVPMVVNAGRLTMQKDQGTLVDAMELVTMGWPTGTHGPAPVLVIAGEGPDRAALEARIAGTHERTDVRLLGFRPDLPDLLAAADLAVSSALWEGQPVWLQEALAAGTPVVATDVGGTSTVLGEAGLLLADGDATRRDRARALADAMTRVLQDETLREDLRRRSLGRAAELPTEADALAAALSAYQAAGPGPSSQGQH